MHLDRFYLLSISTIAAVIGCSGNEGPPSSNRAKVVMQPSNSNNIETGPRNEFGFAKITIHEQETSQEGIIDGAGTEVIQPSSSILVIDISGRLALLQMEGKFLFVPLDQGCVSPADLDSVEGFQYAEPYQCGLAMVSINGTRFYIDANFEKAFNTDFEFAESFHHDRALVKVGEHYRIINTKGQTVAELNYDQVNPQSPWCWQVTRIEEGKYRSGFADLDGQLIAELIYDYVGYYDPAVKRIPVVSNERHGFLDEHAKVVIPVIFDEAEVFDGGKAKVTHNGRSFCINPDGVEVPE